jgi:tripartite-type tricarboxylate transporter receptor subunit TctC
MAVRATSIIARAAALLATGVLAAIAVQPAAAQGDTYPSRPTRLLVGFTPGGATDVLARVAAQKLSERLGQPVVVENRPGGGGMLAGEAVARAAPDGYTLLMGPSGPTVFAPAVYSKVPYDTIKAFQPIGILASYPLVLVVSASTPVKSVAELIAWAKANPDKANYASSSPLFQLSTELFKTRTGASIEHIPFKGSPEGTSALMKGEVLMALIDPGTVVPHITSGKLRLLAHTGAGKNAEFPGTPSLKETGIDVVVEVFSGILAPAGTPAPIVARLEKEMAAIRQMPDVIERLKGLGMPVADSSAKHFTDVIAREIPQWKAVAKAANIKLD